MEEPIKNNAHISYFETIASYNSIALQNKSNYEVILEGLNVYLTLTGCNSATLFSIDPNSFEFYYKTSTALHLENSLNRLFDKLVDQGAIAGALRISNIIEYELCEDDGTKNYCLIVPLIVPSGIIGLIILTAPLPIMRDTLLIDFCRMHANNFALIINNSSLNYELQQLKENMEQTIALRTNDFVKNTREVKRILDSIHTGVIIVNKYSGMITDANFLAVYTVGISKEQFIGKKIEDYFFFHHAGKFSNKIVDRQEGLLRRNNGTLIPIIRTQAEVSLGGTDFIIESFIDISERKKMEDALQKAHFELERRVEERTSQLSKANKTLEAEILAREKAEADILKLYWAVAQSPVAILITDLTGIIEYVNDKFIEMTGYKFEEAVGSNPRILKSGYLTDQYYKSLWDTLQNEGEWKGEHQNKKKNGDLYWVSAFICPIRNKEGDVTHYLGIQEDITDKKQILNELVIAKEKAEESDRMKSTLLSNMSHEFRTPLIGILGFSNFLIEELQNPDQVEMVRAIEQSGKRLLTALDGVLSLSEMEAIESSLKVKKINLANHMSDLVISHLRTAKEKKLEFIMKIKNDQLFVSIDVVLLKKSLSYIIDNAIKFTDDGSITIIADKKEVAGIEWVTIEVIDTGIGINEYDQKIIFDAFRQASEGFTRNYEGCGLGLTISKKMIELLHGRVTILSELSKGSAFTIWLPAVEEKERVTQTIS